MVDGYQPVHHRLDGRLGTREHRAALVAARHAAGVKVDTDAVVNHMTATAWDVGARPR